MLIKLFKIDTRFILLFFLIFSLNLTKSEAMAQNSKYKLYAAVLSNKSYTVGAKNSGVGLFVGDEDGDNWENIAFKNMRTFAIEIFPDHGDGLFYTANGNGVIVSRDGGKTWRVTTDWRITEILEAVAVAENPEITYIGTAYGMWKSLDYGENWQRLTKRFINAVHIDVEDSDRIYIGEEDGMHYSKNAGKSFKAVKKLPYAVNNFAQHKSDAQRLYLGTEDHGIYISNDHGESWQQVDGASANTTVYSVTVDPRNPDIVLAGTYTNGIFRSTDRGKTWQAITNGVNDIPVYNIVMHPDDSTIMFAGTVDKGLLRSTDGGNSWQQFALDGAHVWELEIK